MVHLVGSVSPDPLVSMPRRYYLGLFFVALAVAILIASLQPVPGYMDADYYFAVGKQLAAGRGFTDPFLWNYLDHPQSLPHPSNSYWNPLASIIAAGGMILTGSLDFLSARIGFILLAAFAPLVVAALAFRLTRRRFLALISGAITIFSGYYLPFIVTSDNYSLYMLAGGLFFLLLEKVSTRKALSLGLLAGLFHLARGDGLLWLPLALFAVTVLAYQQAREEPIRVRLRFSISVGLIAFLGYILVMGGWFIRNQLVFGSFLPPGSNYVLWMTNYEQTFSFTPEQFTLQSLLSGGWQEILKVRLSALWQNLGTAFFAQGMIFLFPLVILGAWKSRSLFRVRVGVLGWLALLLAESLLFPFASVRGGFFHAGTAFQPLWFALAPLGLDALTSPLIRRNWKLKQLASLFQAILVIFMVVFSALLVKIRVADSGWNEGEYLYKQVDQFLVDQGAPPDAVVMVRNPPGYFVMTGRQAVVVPYGDVEAVLAASQKFHVRYLVLEQPSGSNPLSDLYRHPEDYPSFTSLGAIGENLILLVQASQ
jgi:hypothetical protein